MRPVYVGFISRGPLGNLYIKMKIPSPVGIVFGYLSLFKIPMMTNTSGIFLRPTTTLRTMKIQ